MLMISTMTPVGRGSIWPAARDLSTHFNKAIPATINCSPRCPRRLARARQDTSEKGRRVSSVFSWQFPLVPITARKFGSIRCKIKREDLTKMQEAKSHWRVLVVEDEAKVARALREGLEREKYEVVVAPTGEEGFFLVNAEEFDLVILDLMLPGRDGLQVLSTLRKRGLQTPVLILTARDAIEDRVEGLDKGADDYLVKPFAFPELLARVRALLRRSEQSPQLRLADLEMDVIARKAKRNGQYLELTARDFELLEYLLRHKEQVVSREMLARYVWKETARATPLDNVMDVHINRLRRKVDELFDRKLIHTVRGVGFVLREEE